MGEAAHGSRAEEMTCLSPQGTVLQGLAEGSLELPMPQRLMEPATSTSLTPLLRDLQLQTPVPRSAKAGRGRMSIPGTITWVAPLDWLEKSMEGSPLLATLRERLSFPPLQEDKGTSISPASVAPAATWTTPPAPLEVGVNTSPEERPPTKDSTAETDSLLWHCSRDQLSGLSRAELEGRLESTLIIMEALSCQMRDAQLLRRPAAPVGPADQREAATQTPISDPKEKEQLFRDLFVDLRKRHQSLQRSRECEQVLAQRLASATKEMREWELNSRELQDSVDAAFLQLQEDRSALGQQQEQMRRLLSQSRCTLQRSCRERAAMEARLETAQRAKEAADQVLESVRCHAGARIEALEKGLETRQILCALLKEARGDQDDLSSGYAECVAEGDRLTAAMQHNWAQMQLDYKAWREMLSTCRTTVTRMQEEVETAKSERAEHRKICDRLEETTVELVEALGRVNQLTEANASLSKDLGAAQLTLASVEREQERLQEERDALSQQLAEKEKILDEMTRLSWEKEQERESAQRDLREASDCREFIEQENQIARRQLAETEEELKATLLTLRERSAQLEDLKDAYEALRQEHTATGEDLASATAALQSARAGMQKLSRSLPEIKRVQAQFLDTADFLKAALRGEVVDVGPRSRPCTPARQTPHRLGSSFVDSILLAAAEKGVETPGLLSEATAFSKATPTAPPTPAEVEEKLGTHILELQEAADQLRVLSSQYLKAAQEEVRSLQADNLRLQHQLESLESQFQAETDIQESNMAKLNIALHARMQNEKELQDVVVQQDEKLRTLFDQSGKIVTLQEEVAQLKCDLQKAETEAAALWGELRGSKPSDIGLVQEKVWLRQEVGKLRELLLEKGKENTELLMKHLSQVKSLEAQLYQAQLILRHHKEAETKMRAVISVLPPELSCTPQLQDLLRHLW